MYNYISKMSKSIVRNKRGFHDLFDFDDDTFYDDFIDFDYSVDSLTKQQVSEQLYYRDTYDKIIEIHNGMLEYAEQLSRENPTKENLIYYHELKREIELWLTTRKVFIYSTT